MSASTRKPRKRRKNEVTTADMIRRELDRSQVYWSGTLQFDYELALRAFSGRDREPDTQEDGSGYVSEDVAAAVQAALAEMIDSLTTDTVCSFIANDKEDEDQAQLETDYVNNLVVQSEEGQTELLQAMHNGLLLRNAVIRVDMEQRTETNKTVLRDVERGDLPAILARKDPMSVVEIEPTDNPGEWLLKEEKIVRQFVCEAVSPMRMVFNIDGESQRMERCTFFAEERYITRSDLVKCHGVSQSKAYSLQSSTLANDIRGRIIQPVDQDVSEPGDPSMELVRVYDCGIRVDKDGDGIAELWRVLYAYHDKEVLREREYPFVWYAVGTPELVPHSILGRSIYDRIWQLADVKTDVVRQWRDNMKFLNRPELIVQNQAVNPDDVSQGVRNPDKVIRADNVDAVKNIVPPDMGTNSQMFLNYLDGQRSEMVGASLDIQNANAQVVGDTAQGIDRQYTKREKVAALQLRTIALTLIREVFKITHATLRTWSQGPTKAKFRGEWVDINTANWQPRDKVRVVPGMTASERQTRMLGMQSTLQQQIMALQSGLDGVLVDAPRLHATLIELGRLARIDMPESYWLDPMSQESQQAAQAKQQQAQAAQRDQAMVAKLLLETQQMVKVWETNVETRFKYFQELMKAEIEQMKLVGKETADMQRMEMIGAGQMMQRGEGERRAANAVDGGNGQRPGTA